MGLHIKWQSGPQQKASHGTIVIENLCLLKILIQNSFLIFHITIPSIRRAGGFPLWVFSSGRFVHFFPIRTDLSEQVLWTSIWGIFGHIFVRFADMPKGTIKYEE